MNNEEPQSTLIATETCIKCDKPVSGGFVTSVNLDGNIIFSTLCWYCIFAEGDSSGNETV